MLYLLYLLTIIVNHKSFNLDLIVEASCELVSRLAFLAVENFSKDVELDQVKDLLDPVLRSAVERLDTEAQKKFVETEYERIILETYLTNDLAPKYYAKRYLSLCNRL